ncbi:MAG: hypothetical protein ABSC71_02810 [Candidatus Acidiferrales bacterium]|jgi:hypothetical protein
MPAPVFTSGPFTGVPTTDAFALAAMNELFANRDTRNPHAFEPHRTTIHKRRNQI